MEQQKKSKSVLEQRNAAWLEGRASVAKGSPILIADDSESDIFFLLRAFSASGVRNPIYVVRNGAEALGYLEGSGQYADRARFPLPQVVFLDLRLPAPNGFEILAWKQAHPEFCRLLFVAMSNFDSLKAINDAYDAGANTFLSKPIHPRDIANIIEGYEEYWSLVGQENKDAK